MQRMPYPPFIDDTYLVALQAWLPFVLLVSYIYPAINIVKSVVYEKEKKLKVAFACLLVIQLVTSLGIMCVSFCFPFCFYFIQFTWVSPLCLSFPSLPWSCYSFVSFLFLFIFFISLLKLTLSNFLFHFHLGLIVCIVASFYLFFFITFIKSPLSDLLILLHLGLVILILDSIWCLFPLSIYSSRPFLGFLSIFTWALLLY